jgi:hypothetical protein
MSPNSPFLQCPPEIRNSVYDELFHHTEPIELEPSLSGNLPAQLQCFIPGINLLATNRQFYEEASSSLYSQHAFVVHYNDLYRMRSWTSAISRNRILVANVYINIGWEDHDLMRRRNVREILDEMWSQPFSKLKFDFITKTPYSSPDSWFFPPGLNNVLAALYPTVSPQLGIFVRSFRTVYAAVIDVHGYDLCLTLRTPHHLSRFTMPRIFFDLSSTGELQIATPIPFTPGFDDIWHFEAVQTRVVSFLESPRAPVAYNLTHKTISQAFPAALHVDVSFRSAFMGNYEAPSGGRKKSEVAFKVQMSTHKSKTSFGEYKVLKDWVAHGRPQSFDFGGGRTFRHPYYNGPPITLIFELAEHGDLESIRVEVTGLVLATLALSLESPLSIQLHQGAPDFVPITKAFSTLYRLRRALLVFLSDLLAMYPGEKHSIRPRVWADGYLRIREAELDNGNGNTKVIVNDRYKWNPAKLNKEKKIALRRFATNATTLECECELCFERSRISHAKSDTLLKYTKFLARLVKLYVHLEVCGWGSRHKRVYDGCCSY